MHRALELARQALGSTSPNPAVGAVIVQDGRIVGEGFTQPAGQDHAEIVALTQAGEKARCSTMYVTLEPCPHTGRTLPCTEAILRAGISEVYFSTIDPNPLVSGKGLRELREKGITVHTGQGEDLSRRLNEAYFKYITSGTPFVTAKFAASLDGKLATRSGDSHWISSAESRQWAHNIRAASDAVMVGIGTVLADDPLLTVRDKNDAPLPKQPLRVIVDSSLCISLYRPGSSVNLGLFSLQPVIQTQRRFQRSERSARKSPFCQRKTDVSIWRPCSACSARGKSPA